MRALGLIETRGLLVAIECADVMLKTAQVELVGRTLVGGGLVTIAVTGDVGAVKAAVEAGAVAVEKINGLLLVSQHVIPRPHKDLASIVVVTESTANVNETEPEEEQTTTGNEGKMTDKECASSLPMRLKSFSKEEVDAFVQTFGLEKSLNALKALSLVKLRKLAREYKDLIGAGSALSKANKDLLLQRLKRYYERESKN